MAATFDGLVPADKRAFYRPGDSPAIDGWADHVKCHLVVFGSNRLLSLVGPLQKEYKEEMSQKKRKSNWHVILAPLPPPRSRVHTSVIMGFIRPSLLLALLLGSAASETLTTLTVDANITKRASSYWYENIAHQGIAPFSPAGYTLYRNVKDFNAKGSCLSSMQL